MTSITAHDLHRMLKQVTPHMSTDDTLPVLNAVRLEARGGHLFAAATDRYTLAVTRTPIVAEADWQAALPAGDVPAVTTWLENEDTVTISLSADHDGERTRLNLASSTGQIRVDTEDSTYGAFPDWRRLLRDQFAAEQQPVPLTGFTTEYLARWEQAATALSAWQTGPDMPLILIDDAGGFIGMQMPARPRDATRDELIAQWARCLTPTTVVDGQTYRLDIRWIDQDGDPWEYAAHDLGGEPLMQIPGLDGDEHTLAEVIERYGPIQPSTA
ncbi:DNA polymerase III subunit beta family protein [Streptomyces sp. NPDC055078]